MSSENPVRVRDVMKTKFDTVDGMDTVSNALEAMHHQDNKCLIVKKRHDDDEYGIVLITDIAREVLARDKAPSRLRPEL